MNFISIHDFNAECPKCGTSEELVTAGAIFESGAISKDQYAKIFDRLKVYLENRGWVLVEVNTPGVPGESGKQMWCPLCVREFARAEVDA